VRAAKALRAEGTAEHSGRRAFQFREDVGTIKDVMCRVRGAAPAIPVHADAGFLTTSVPVAPWMRMSFVMSMSIVHSLEPSQARCPAGRRWSFDGVEPGSCKSRSPSSHLIGEWHKVQFPEWQFLLVISFKPRLLVLPARFDEDESDRHSMPMMLPLVVARRTNGDCNEQQQQRQPV
jgi:hypothetical protein